MSYKSPASKYTVEYLVKELGITEGKLGPLLGRSTAAGWRWKRDGIPAEFDVVIEDLLQKGPEAIVDTPKAKISEKYTLDSVLELLNITQAKLSKLLRFKTSNVYKYRKKGFPSRYDSLIDNWVKNGIPKNTKKAKEQEVEEIKQEKPKKAKGKIVALVGDAADIMDALSKMNFNND